MENNPYDPDDYEDYTKFAKIYPTTKKPERKKPIIDIAHVLALVIAGFIIIIACLTIGILIGLYL